MLRTPSRASWESHSPLYADQSEFGKGPDVVLINVLLEC